MKIPVQMFAGDSLSWLDDPGQDNMGVAITSADWTLVYTFRQGSLDAVIATSAASGSGWSTTLSAEQSATFAKGPAFWQAVATKGAERRTLGAGQITVLPNLADAAAGAYEGRSQAQQDLEAVQAAMRGIISGGAVAEYSIAGRSLRKLPMTDLILLEQRYKAIVAAEKKASNIANGLGNPSNIYVRFKK